MPSSMENYKARMGSGLKDFVESMESPLNKLFSDLNSRRGLGTSFQQEDNERLDNINRTTMSSFHLMNDLNNLFSSNESETLDNLNKLGETGWVVDPPQRVAMEYGFVLCMTYHATMERLKKSLRTFIYWPALGINPDKITGVGGFLGKLKEISPNNSFLEYFDKNIRNSIAHLTFGYKDKKLLFYKNLNDTNPIEKTLTEFMIEVKNINALAESFVLAYADFMGAPPIDDFVT